MSDEDFDILSDVLGEDIDADAILGSGDDLDPSAKKNNYFNRILDKATLSVIEY